MPNWTLLRPQATFDTLGFLPGMLHEEDPRCARDQLDANYQHGGGWRAFNGFTMLPNGDLKYPGDPPTRLLAKTKLRDETIHFYDYSWVAIIQPDGTFEISRMD